MGVELAGGVAFEAVGSQILLQVHRLASEAVDRQSPVGHAEEAVFNRRS